MKIAVTGAHRVGKTTLIDKLLDSLPEYIFQTEPYYELEERGHIFSDIPTPEDYLAQLEYSIEQITEAGDHVIFDRCPIDLLAYIQATDEFESFDIQSLYHRVQDSMAEIDLLVFIPIEEPDVIGCAESDLPELRRQVNEILNDWLWDFDLNTVEITGPLATRTNQIIQYLSKI